MMFAPAEILLLRRRSAPIVPAPGPPQAAVSAKLLLLRRAGSPVVAVPFTFEVDLLAYLTASGLSAYPGHVPQKAPLPAICYLCVSEGPYYTLARAAGLTARVYQFSCFSTSYLESVRYEARLRAALHGFKGAMGSTTIVSSRLQQCLDLPYEANVDGSDRGTYHRASEYRIAFKEPIPILS